VANKPRVKVVFEVDSSGYSAAVNKARGQLVDFGGASKNVSHGMISDMQATSGGLRLLEGGLNNNLRAAERFLASIKGVGTAMKFIFPAVGLIAVGSIIAKGVGELTTFIKKTKEAGAEFRASFQEMQNSARLANDELAKTNINLENQLAKLTGKHENVVAAELIEARIQADNLATSAAHAAKEIKDLLEKSQEGFLAKALSAGGNDELFGNIKNFQHTKADALQRASDATHNGDKAGAAKANADYDQQVKNERAYLKQQREFRSGTGDRDGAFSGDQSIPLTAINAALDLNYDESDRTDLNAQNLKVAAAVKKAQDAKDFSAAQRTAATKQMGGYDKQFKKNDASIVAVPNEEDAQFNARKLTEEARFWAQKLDINKKGSLVYQDIQEKLAEIDIRANQMYAEAQNARIKMDEEQAKKDTEYFGANGPLDQARDSDSTESMKSGGKDVIAMLSGMHEGVTVANQNEDAWTEAKISISLAAGQISKYDAAAQTLQLHRLQNDRANNDMAAARAALERQYGPEVSAKTPEALAAYAKLDNEQAGVAGQYKVQSAQDVQNVNEQKPLGAWKTSLDQFVEQSRDTASQVRDIWTNALTSVNDELVKIVSTKHNYNLRQTFGNLGAGMFRDVAGAGLTKGEGAVMGALGFGGKVDGSAQGKALWVRMAADATSAGGSIGGAAKKVGSSISSLFKGSGGASAGDFDGFGDGSADAFVTGGSGGSSGGGVGSAVSTLASIIPMFFADGGDPPVGKMSIVGERGPELFIPHAAGTVIPNGAFGGSTINHHIAVDARGANDPAAVDAAVQRGIYKASSALTAASMHAQRESNARKPSSAR
jgi:hypothetical protein